MEARLYSDKIAIAANQNVKEKEYWLKQLSGDLVKSCFPYDRNLNKKEEGETCQRGGECLSENCDNNICIEPGCSDDDDCGTGKFCNQSSNLCKSKFTDNSVCERDGECLSSNCLFRYVQSIASATVVQPS